MGAWGVFGGCGGVEGRMFEEYSLGILPFFVFKKFFGVRLVFVFKRKSTYEKLVSA